MGIAGKRVGLLVKSESYERAAEGEILTCLWHGSWFNVRTDAEIKEPAK